MYRPWSRNRVAESLSSTCALAPIALAIAILVVSLSATGGTNSAMWSLGFVGVLAVAFPISFYANTELGIGGLLLVLMMANNLRSNIASAGWLPFLPEVVAVTMLMLLHLGKSARRRVPLAQWNGTFAPAALLGGSLFLSSVMSGEGECLRLSAEAALGILVFWVVASELTTVKQVTNLLLILVSLVALGGLFSFYRLLREIPLEVLAHPSALQRTSLIYSRSLFAGPMDFGSALVTVLSLAAVSAQVQTGWKRWVAQLSVVVFMVLILLLFQRGAWLVGGAVAALWAVFGARRHPRWLLVLLLLVAAIVGISQDVFETRVPGLSSVLTERGVVGRVQGWQAAWEMMWDYPLYGVGLGQYRFRFLQYRPSGGLYDYFWHAHNLLLNLGAEAGVVSLALFMVVLALFFRNTLAVVASPRGDLKTVGGGLLLAMLGYLAHGLTSAVNFVDFQHYSLVNTVIFWIIVAMATTLGPQAQAKAARAATDGR